MTLEEEIATLRTENAVLREQVRTLLAEVQDLRGQLAKDRHNRSKPPSRDGLARKPKRLRKPSGKQPGGQPGHAGHQVSLVKTPEAVVVHRPERCGACQQALPDDAPQWIERRPVDELPPVQLGVTEHQLLHVRCPSGGATTTAEAPAGVSAPRQYGPRLRAVATYLVQPQVVPSARPRDGLAARFGAALSVGTLVNLARQGAERLQPVAEAITAIEAALRSAAVLHHDETGLRVAGPAGATLQWTHVTGPNDLTHYARQAARGVAHAAWRTRRGARGVAHAAWRPWRPAASSPALRASACTTAGPALATTPLAAMRCAMPTLCVS